MTKERVENESTLTQSAWVEKTLPLSNVDTVKIDSLLLRLLISPSLAPFLFLPTESIES